MQSTVVQNCIEGIVTGRHARQGRVYFDVNDGAATHACYDGTGGMGPFAVYPGRPVRCIGKPSGAIAGYFEVERIEHADGAAIERSIRAAMAGVYRDGSHNMFEDVDAL